MLSILLTTLNLLSSYAFCLEYVSRIITDMAALPATETCLLYMIADGPGKDLQFFESMMNTGAILP